MIVCILLNITKMKLYRFLNVYFLQSSPQSQSQLAGIIIGSVCGAKAGHGNGMDIGSGQPQQIKGLRRHQKGQRRIQPTGDTQNGLLAAGVMIAFL